MTHTPCRCPFCGVLPPCDPSGFVRHPESDKYCPLNGFGFAIERWNTRAAETELREVLEKARDKFREYAEIHKAKLPSADAYDPRSVPDIMRKVAANLEMAKLCDAALSKAVKP